MSLSQSTIKFISSLRRKKFRQNYHKFTVEGVKIVRELLSQQAYHVEALYVERDSEFATTLAASRPEPTLISTTELQRISQLTTPNQVLAVVGLPDHSNVPLPDLSTRWSLYLDGIQSPANLGAILRVADWFGFEAVFGGPGTADLYNHKSLQASMGAFLRVDYREAALADLLRHSPTLPVFAADLTGENVFAFSPPGAGMLVMGNEGGGIQPTTRALVTDYLSIPRAPGRRTESLNVAVATGLLCGVLRNLKE